MPSPNIMGSVLAKLTNGSNVAIVQMGATLPTSNPPIRVAEEYAMLDCISGGRLVAGLPLGSPMDVNRSEKHTAEIQSRLHLVWRLLLEKKNITDTSNP